MSINRILIIFFILLNSFVSLSNNNIDSLKNVISNSVDTTKFDTYIELAKIHYKNDDFFKVINLLKEANSIKQIDNIRLAKSNNFLGATYYRITDYSKSLKYYFISLKLKEKINNEELLAAAYSNIAQVYTSLEQYKESLDFLEKSYIIAKKNKDIKQLIIVLNNKGRNFYRQEKYEEALQYFIQAKKLIETTNINKALLMVNISDVYIKLDSLEKAKDLLFSTIKICQKENNKYNLADTYAYIGNISEKQNSYKEALYYYNLALETSNNIYLYIDKEVYRGIINIYSIKNNTDSLQKYINLFYLINDRLNRIHTDEIIENLNNKKRLETQEQEIQTLIIKNQLAKRKEIFYIFLFIVTTIILILLLVNKRIKDNSAKLVVKNSIKQMQYENVIDSSCINVSKIEHPKNLSTLSEEYKTMLELSISKLLKKEKNYLQHDFTLNELAKILDTNRKYISQVINERYEQNFSTFINSFRINELIKLLSDPANEKYTIESLYKKVGFKSSSAFNAAFKKQTGLTPSAFIKEMKANKFKNQHQKHFTDS